jgi:DNA modification methylase
MESLLNNIHKEDCLKFMDKLEEHSVNILYSDPPYNMGSIYEIDKVTGHYEFVGVGSDFMSKWDAMSGVWWDSWFSKVNRIVKEGGFVVLHNIDRQSDMWSYYARRNGFMPLQKLYWLFLDNFPKGVDLGLKLDNLLGVEREKVGIRKGAQSESTGRYGSWGKTSIMDGIKDRAKDQSMTHHKYLQGKMSMFEETIATSDIAKKYDGYKYGQAALKQVLEEILVFWKRPKDSSLTVPRAVVLFEDRLREKRPTRIHPSVFNIRETRVQAQRGTVERWTPQLLVDDRLKVKLINKFGHEDSFRVSETVAFIPILDDEVDNWNYVKKATVEEKEWGLDNFEPKTVNDGRKKDIDNPFQRGQTLRKNTHPSPKPQALCKWVLNLFKLPNPEEMVIYDPFSGQGSIPLAAKRLGMQWLGTELDDEYFELAKAKLTYKEETKQGELF